MPSVLLHSLTFYGELLKALAAVPANPDVVEVGSQEGEVSVLLADAAGDRQGTLSVIEPYPSAILRDLADARTNVRIVEALSPDAIATAGPAGLYVLDGDHNYSVVSRELDAIFAMNSDSDVLVVMHDVGWPWGRRDMYYAPDLLPPGEVHAHSYTRGVVLDQAELAPPGHGFRSEGAYAIATSEGGPRNGVRTAAEDAVRRLGDLELLFTPLVFGLGVLGRPSSPGWSRVLATMQPYLENPTLELMERNRIALFLRTLELQDASFRARGGRLKARLRGAVERRKAPS